MRQPEHRVPQERPEQPADPAAAHGDEPEHEERVQAEDVEAVHAHGRQQRHAAGRGGEGAEQGRREVVVPAGLAEGEVGVPGQGVEEGEGVVVCG